MVLCTYYQPLLTMINYHWFQVTEKRIWEGERKWQWTAQGQVVLYALQSNRGSPFMEEETYSYMWHIHIWYVHSYVHIRLEEPEVYELCYPWSKSLLTLLWRVVHKIMTAWILQWRAPSISETRFLHASLVK